MSRNLSAPGAGDRDHSAGHPLRADGLVTRQVGGECIILQVRAGVADLDSVYTLNDTGSWLWDRLDGTTSLSELAAAVAGEFQVDLPTAQADVSELIDELCTEGLVRLGQR